MSEPEQERGTRRVVGGRDAQRPLEEALRLDDLSLDASWAARPVANGRSGPYPRFASPAASARSKALQ